MNKRVNRIIEKLLKEGNPVSDDLPIEVDSLLQDISQTTNELSYTDIMNASEKLSADDIKWLQDIAIKMDNDADENSVDTEDALFDKDDEGLILSTKGRLSDIVRKIKA